MNKALEPESLENSPKLAQKVAESIERDIVRLGWPVGRSLGSEAELVARYGVGRWVMREAINIVAADGLLELRRGRSGGLFVAAPAEDAVITMLQNYMELSQVKIADVIAARTVVESLAVRLAAERIDLDRADELRRRAGNSERATVDGNELLRDIFAITGNLALYVFGCALSNTLQSLLHRQGFDDRGGHYRQAFSEMRHAQVEAIIAADAETGIAIQRRCDERWQELARSLARKKTARARSQTSGAKASDILIGQLLDDIAAHEWQENFNLGSEPELLSRFGVSRETLREAVRRLERHGIVQMRLGRGTTGGLRIAKPNPTATVKSAALYLKYTKLPVDAVYEMQIALDLAAISHLIALPDTQRQVIGDELNQFNSVLPVATVTAFEANLYAFYLHLSSRCGNPVIDLFIRIMASLITIEPADGRAAVSVDTVSTAQTAAQRLTAAITKDDSTTARRCLLEIRRISTMLKPHERSAEDIVRREFHNQWSERAFMPVSKKDGPHRSKSPETGHE
jgi:DNA-binding FadR family transcriptional regulator